MPDETAAPAADAETPAIGGDDVAVAAEAPPEAVADAPGEPAPAASGRENTGVVVSSKAHKTITVLVERRVKHPVYGKFIRRSTRIAAHDETNACNEGDTVTIVETRPISKTKSWALGRIVERYRDTSAPVGADGPA